MSELFVTINGEILPAKNASLLITDLSIQRGYGVFDFLKTINGQPFFLGDHLDRFYNSAAQMRLPVSVERSALKALISALMAKNNQPNSGIRITLTGGYSADGYSIAQPNLIITQQPFEVNKNNSANSIRLVTFEHQRQLSHVKTLDYLMAIHLQPEIMAKKANDVLYRYNGLVSECPRANFFIVNEFDEIVTPQHNILHGITRKQLLKITDLPFRVVERDVRLEDVYKAKEAFITSTTKNILPVVKIDDHEMNNGQPGEITKILSSSYEKLLN